MQVADMHCDTVGELMKNTSKNTMKYKNYMIISTDA